LLEATRGRIDPLHDDVPGVRRSAKLHGANAMFEMVLAMTRAFGFDKCLVEIGID
jgi:hypothetical protein